MRFEKRITVELDQTDAAIAAVLLAENAGREALKALLADRTAEIGGTTNRGPRAIADSYIKVGDALTRAITDEKGNRGLQSAWALSRSTTLMNDAMQAADTVTEASEDES